MTANRAHDFHWSPVRQFPSHATRCACLLVIISALLLPACRPVLAIDFHGSIEAARMTDTANRPLVVSFGAPWCGWCRKMEVDTFDSPEVNAIAEKYLWVKVDVDEQTELAARYQVEGLPRTIVLDAKGRMIGSAEGYLSPGRFVKFLEESLTKPLPNESLVDELLQQLAQAQGEEPTRKVVVSLLEILAKPNRLARGEILAALKQRKGPAHTVLLELMSDERLAVRAAAGSCLKHCLDNDLTFDPFADKKARESQLGEWRKALGAKSQES